MAKIVLFETILLGFLYKVLHNMWAVCFPKLVINCFLNSSNYQWKLRWPNCLDNKLLSIDNDITTPTLFLESSLIFIKYEDLYFLQFAEGAYGEFER